MKINSLEFDNSENNSKDLLEAVNKTIEEKTTLSDKARARAIIGSIKQGMTVSATDSAFAQKILPNEYGKAIEFAKQKQDKNLGKNIDYTI